MISIKQKALIASSVLLSKISLKLIFDSVAVAAAIALAVATWGLYSATQGLVQATDNLVKVEKEHGDAALKKAAIDNLYRLQSVMDGTPNTRECMRYVLSISDKQYQRNVKDKKGQVLKYDYLHDLMDNSWSVPLIAEDQADRGRLNACLGGFYAQHPDLRVVQHSPCGSSSQQTTDDSTEQIDCSDKFNSLPVDGVRTYMRQQIGNFANVLDLTSNFLLLDERFHRDPKQIKLDSQTPGNRLDPFFLMWKEIRGVTDSDSRMFFVRWHGGSPNSLFEDFPMCGIVANDLDDERCGL